MVCLSVGLFVCLSAWLSVLAEWQTVCQYNTIQYSTVQYNTIQYNTIQYNTIQYNAMQCNAMQCNAMQYKQYNNCFFAFANLQYLQIRNNSCSLFVVIVCLSVCTYVVALLLAPECLFVYTSLFYHFLDQKREQTFFTVCPTK